MTARGVPSRGVRAAGTAVLALAAALPGCAPAVHTALETRAASASEVPALVRRAANGDRSAQLELGIRYEEGRGVAVNLARAMELYASAATDGGTTLWLYSPPVGERGRGEVVPVSGAGSAAGREAARRLRNLQRRLTQ